MPNFVAISQTVAEVSRFWIFQDGGSHHLGFFKFYIFEDRNGQKDELRLRCQFSIFKDEFSKFQNF